MEGVLGSKFPPIRTPPRTRSTGCTLTCLCRRRAACPCRATSTTHPTQTSPSRADTTAAKPTAWKARGTFLRPAERRARAHADHDDPLAVFLPPCVHGPRIVHHHLQPTGDEATGPNSGRAQVSMDVHSR
ncbi:hypothetical protein CEXT_531141 [Caerostris extrusa]|uniref:Uncharacterized protein n=1 Tax=Caerostris extrusa TaxID=172846 RepID=A0AAV4XF11_CAEEX|nr:hypothetical protein CEXT_531141 [Caerostris extrusa]